MAGLGHLLAAPTRNGTICAIDGRELWLVHNHVWPERTDFEAVDRDAWPHIILSVGLELRYEVVSKEDRIGRRLVVTASADGAPPAAAARRWGLRGDRHDLAPQHAKTRLRADALR